MTNSFPNPERKKGELHIQKNTSEPRGSHPHLPQFCLPLQKSQFLPLVQIFLSVEANSCTLQLTMKIGAMNLPRAEAVIFENRLRQTKTMLS